MTRSVGRCAADSSAMPSNGSRIPGRTRRVSLPGRLPTVPESRFRHAAARRSRASSRSPAETTTPPIVSPTQWHASLPSACRLSEHAASSPSDHCFAAAVSAARRASCSMQPASPLPNAVRWIANPPRQQNWPRSAGARRRALEGRISQMQGLLIKQLAYCGQELASKQRGNRSHRKEELPLFGRAPAFAIGT